MIARLPLIRKRQSRKAYNTLDSKQYKKGITHFSTKVANQKQYSVVVKVKMFITL